MLKSNDTKAHWYTPPGLKALYQHIVDRKIMTCTCHDSILSSLSFPLRPPPPHPPPYRCNGCNMSPLEGPRYHCQVCADFDFCQSCFDKGQSHNHAFERIDDQGHPAVFVGSPRSRRRALRFVSCPLTFPSLSLYRS